MEWFRAKDGGADRDRTCDLLIANETLYQLSYDPIPPAMNMRRRSAKASVKERRGVTRTYYRRLSFKRLRRGFHQSLFETPFHSCFPAARYVEKQVTFNRRVAELETKPFAIGEPQNLLPSMRQPEETTARAKVISGVNIRTVRRQGASEIGPEVCGQQCRRVLKLETCECVGPEENGVSSF